jgi:hypothetical protein
MERRNSYTVLVGKPEGKTGLERLRCAWEDDIKMNLGDTGWDRMD